MKIIIITVLFCVLSVAKSLPDARPLPAPAHQEPENPRKRQSTSYTTNIVHDSPSDDGKTAQSSISVNFGQRNKDKPETHVIHQTPKIHQQSPTIHHQSPSIHQKSPTVHHQPTIIHHQSSIVHHPEPTNQQLSSNHLQSSNQSPLKQIQPQINTYPTPKTLIDYMQQDAKPQKSALIQTKISAPVKHQVSISQPSGSDVNLLAPLLVQNHGAYLETQDQNAIHRIERPQFSQAQQFSQENHKQKSPQLFNVGYSINIMNHEPKLKFRIPNPPPQSHRQTKLVHGDIITGTHKDTVGKPSELNLVPSYQAYHAPTEIHHQLNLIPANYLNIEHKEEKNEPQLFTEVEPKNSYVWKTLSPGVEISGFLSEEEQSQKFDHAAALGRSEGFDISNVVDTEGHADQIVQHVRPQPIKSSFSNNKLEFDKAFYEKFYKSLRQNPIFYKQDIALPLVASTSQPIKLGILKSATHSVEEYPSFPSAPTFDQKLLIPNLQGQKLDTRFIRYGNSNNIGQHSEPIPVPLSPQKLVQAQQYQIHENVNEGPPAQEAFRQGRFINPGQSFRNFGPTYRMRQFPREVYPTHMINLRPPPMLIRIPKYVQ